MSWWLIPILLTYFLVCVLLMGIILIQSGKGGGLSSLGSAAGGISDALGATSAEKTLNKITTGIAVAFMVLAIILSLAGSLGTGGSRTDEIFGDQPPASAPAAGVPATGIPASGSATIPAQPETTNQLGEQLPPGITEQQVPPAAEPATEPGAEPAPAESEPPAASEEQPPANP
jgi:preprotein translocase subunit SecG